MAETLTFDTMIRLLHQGLEQTHDHRTGKNTRHTIKDAEPGAFAVFLVQPPLFPSARSEAFAFTRTASAVHCDVPDQVSSWQVDQMICRDCRCRVLLDDGTSKPMFANLMSSLVI